MQKITGRMASRTFAITLPLTLGLLLLPVARVVFPPDSRLVAEHLGSIVSGIQTLCMAVVGIMAGFVALATATKESYWMRRFRSIGLMAEYVFFYCYTIGSLIFTYALSLIALAQPSMLAPCVAFLSVNLLQVGIVMYGGHSIATQSIEPHAE